MTSPHYLSKTIETKTSGFRSRMVQACAFQHTPKIFTLESGVLFIVAVCTGHETALELLAHLQWAHHMGPTVDGGNT